MLLDDSKRLKIRWFVSLWLWRLARLAVPFIPTPVWYAGGWLAARATYLLMTRSRHNLQANLRLILPEDEIESASRRVFYNVVRYGIDIEKLRTMSRKTLRRRADIAGLDCLKEAVAAGNGVICVGVHHGNVEMGAARLIDEGIDVSVVVRPNLNGALDESIQNVRRAMGIKVIPDRNANFGTLRCLKRGEVLAMLVDVVDRDEGVDVEFCGQTMQFSSAPARLALRTGARVIPTVVARDDKHPQKVTSYLDFDMEFRPTGNPEADVKSLTKEIARRLEVFVRRFPDQWYAFRAPAKTSPEPAVNKDALSATGLWKARALKAATRLADVMPERVAYAGAGLIGDLAYRLRPNMRADVEDNMRHVLGPDAKEPDVRKAAREVFRSVATYYVEMLRIPQMRIAERLGQDINVHGRENLDAALASGHGAIVATAHFGNGEIGAQIGMVLGYDVLVLTEPFESAALRRMMLEIRSRSVTNSRFAEAGFSGVATAIRHLRKGGVLAIASDRDIQKSGTPIPFFGAEAPFPLGAAELAQRTGAKLLTSYCTRSGRGFDVYFQPSLALVDTGNPKQDAVTNTRALLERMETWIRSDPGQWFVLERFWKALPAEDGPAAPVETSAGTIEPDVAQSLAGAEP